MILCADTVRRFVFERISAIARRKKVALDGAGDDYCLLDSGLLDSLGFVELVAAIEEEFDVEVDFGSMDPEAFTTIGGIVQCAVSKSAG